ncbi:MAG TPA: BolA/IbaG family iron-sulfur metabolism protein [Usitatibacter sp.]|nr:BolA/IbaG family iron-sulfur metabolism protein [Usitatibacter sp.]
MVQPDSIAASIRAGLDCTHLDVRGDGAHFEAVVVSPAFAGLPRVRQHQLVYAAIAPLLAGDAAPVHAIDRLECRVPA